MNSLLYMRQLPVQVLSSAHELLLGLPVRGIVVVVRVSVVDVEAGLEQLPRLLIQMQLVLPLIN